MVLGCIGALVVPLSARADWNQPVGGPSPINESATRNADAISLVEVGGVPYVVWNEDTTQPPAGGSSQIRAARLSDDGLSWEKVGNSGSHPISHLASTSSHNPDIAEISGVPWVAWSENITQTDQEIRAARFDVGTQAWVRVVDTDHPINHLRPPTQGGGGMADAPTIAGVAGTPYVSFFEADPGSGSLIFPNSDPAQIWVDRLDPGGTSWSEVGGGPVSDPSLDAAFPRMAVVGGVPWLVYFQIAIVGGNPALEIQAAHLSDDGQSWIHVGPVRIGSFDDFGDPTIADIGGRPYVALTDKEGGAVGRVRVFKLNAAGDGWDEVGGGPASGAGNDASNVSLVAIQGQPWVAWRQGTNGGGRQIRVARLAGGAWAPVGTSLNADPSHDTSFGPELASVGGFPWIAFGENDNSSGGACCVQERVSRLEPAFISTSAASQSTAVTLLASLKTYGLPFPVMFEYGPDPSLGSSTGSSSSTDDPAFLSASVTGLATSTLYYFRPSATAGTAAPAIDGGLGAFMTGSGSPFFLAILDHRRGLDRGQHLRVRFLISDDAEVMLSVYRHRRLVASEAGSFDAGQHSLVWNGRSAGHAASLGRYRVLIEASDGVSSTESRHFRVRVRRR